MKRIAWPLSGVLKTVAIWAVASAILAPPLFANERVLADFEGQSYGAWRATGDSFGKAPVRGSLPNQTQIVGFLGDGFANSYHGGDAAIGELTSPEFTLSHDYVSLLLGGGNNVGKVGAELLVDDKVVRSTSGSDAEELIWHNWNVREFRGDTAQIRIFDRTDGGFGHVLADQVVLSDVPKSSYDAQRLQDYRRSTSYYREPHRPQFHFTPELNWMNDPNGLVFYDGEYHLFYQHNPFGNSWGHISWGHAVSGDLMHWRHLPIAIWEEDGVMIFSGSAVVDHDNTSGFGIPGVSPLVAIYTGHQRGKQTQCLAFSNDRGRTWTKYAGNPVLDLNEQDFRDPKVCWHEPSRKWVMVVSLAAQKRLQFYGSPNLKTWTLLSEFGPAGEPSKSNWECPDLFELPIEGEPGRTKWVLHVGMGNGAVAGGSGGEYFVGDFDGKRFACDDPQMRSQWTDFGRDNYATVSWSDIPSGDGRRIWIGWMNNWETHLLPTSRWRSAMTLPRKVTLRRQGDRLSLVQRPVKELESLRDSHWQLSDVPVDGDSSALAQAGIEGAHLEIIAEIAVGDAKEVGLTVREGENERTIVGYDVVNEQLFVDRRQSGNTSFHKAFAGRHAAPLPLQNGRVMFRIFVDSSSIEVFGNDGTVVITDRIFPSPTSTAVGLYSRGGAAELVSLDAWTLRSVWPEN